MASYTLHEVSGTTLAKARAQASEHGRTLDDELRGFLARLATHGPLGALGGFARAKALSARRRSEIARHAAMTRHHGRRRKPS